LAQGAKMKRIACIGEAMIELSMDGDQAHLGNLLIFCVV
jgi:hypothetical protein